MKIIFKNFLRNFLPKLFGWKSKKTALEDQVGLGQSGQEEKKINNNTIRFSQAVTVIMALAGILVIMTLAALYMQRKTEKAALPEKPPALKIELADKAVDGEHMLLKHHQGELQEAREELSARIKNMEEKTDEVRAEVMGELKAELDTVRQQLAAARAELSDAGEQLRQVALEERDRLGREPRHEASHLDIQDFGDKVEYGIPKSAADYIPEGTYFTGYLLGGLVLSTALNSKDENPSFVTIELRERGNLARENKLNVKECTLHGSAYGEQASERAIIRLEKMVCKQDGMYITSKIAGRIYGPDGLEGIKGQIVDTGSKHIRNAMIGGIISGLSGSAKGQEGLSIGAGGLVSSRKKGFKEVAEGGMLSGVSNAGEKVADYYLRQAESLSPVLVIPGGVRVNPKITEGFFVGEISTHRRIRQQREANIKSVRNQKADGEHGYKSQGEYGYEKEGEPQ